MHYNRFRYYEPGIGRYISADPIGQAGGVNVYGYARSRPTRFIDPRGEAAIAILFTPPGAAALAAAGKACAFVGTAAAGALGLDAVINMMSGEEEGGESSGSEGAPPAPDYGSTPEGRPFTKHYGEETGPERNIPGSVVDQTVNENPGVDAGDGKTAHYDPNNDVTVITGDGGSIVSAHRGKPRSNQY